MYSNKFAAKLMNIRRLCKENVRNLSIFMVLSTHYPTFRFVNDNGVCARLDMPRQINNEKINALISGIVLIKKLLIFFFIYLFLISRNGKLKLSHFFTTSSTSSNSKPSFISSSEFTSFSKIK